MMYIDTETPAIKWRGSVLDKIRQRGYTWDIYGNDLLARYTYDGLNRLTREDTRSLGQGSAISQAMIRSRLTTMQAASVT